mmetsp:Transcript_37586/g.77190  ORF Transcript_37586/g.77190 Transcript_37586/m.77190 type:complete len:378 (-) Transcript_37586:356-1489(-)
MHATHELVLGRERHAVDTRLRLFESLQPLNVRNAHLESERQQRNLSRVPDSRVQLAVEVEPRAVAQDGALKHLPHRFNPFLADHGPLLVLNNTVRHVAHPGHVVQRLCRLDLLHRHLILGERTGLVGADSGDRSESLNGRQLPDDGVVAGHELHGQGKRDGHYRRQALGDDGDGDGNGRLEGIADRLVVCKMREHEGGKSDDENENRDPATEDLELYHQVGLHRVHSADHGADAPDLCKVTSADHNSLSVAVHDHGRRKGQILAVAQRGVPGNRSDVFVDGVALSGKHRLQTRETSDLEQTHVSRHLVTGFERNDVSRHEFFRGNLELVAFADDHRIRGKHVLDGVRSFLGLPLLHQANTHIDHHHSADQSHLFPLF